MQKMLITGARSGILNAFLEKVKAKYFIYVAVHTKSELIYIQKKYQQEKNIYCLKLDVTDEKDLNKIKNLDIDLFVSGAAVGYGGSLLEIPISLVRENYEVNVFGNLILLQIVLKQMIKKGRGRVLILSSLASILPLPFLGSYCATKASLRVMGTVLREEMFLLKKKIPIILIEPGVYHTGFNQLMLDNKYDWMDQESFFECQLEKIKKLERIPFQLLEKKKMHSIVRTMEKALTSKYPKRIYRTPFFQAMGAKIYQIFFQ